MKLCNKCGIEKPLEEFSIYKSGKYRIGKPHSHCKECEKAKTIKWVKKNRDKHNKYQLEYYHKRRSVV